jgi:hypothetical protein
MSIQSQIKDALLRYLESGDVTDFGRLIDACPEIISIGYGEYPDMHRLMDLKVEDRNFRVCRQISQKENITLTPIDDLSDTPGVPLWLTGEKLTLWAAHEQENPSNEPTDWSKYR